VEKPTCCWEVAVISQAPAMDVMGVVVVVVSELLPHPARNNSDPTNSRRFMPLPWLRAPIIKELTFRFKHETHGCSGGSEKLGWESSKCSLWNILY
jgi:hypothetical protein